MDTSMWNDNLPAYDGRRRSRLQRRWARGCVALGLVMALGIGVVPDVDAQSGSGRLYRYTDDQGRVEIANAVPADRAAGGYDVLDAATGQVVETVAPQLSQQQLAEKLARDGQAEACQRNIERVQALYGSVTDIDAAADQAQRALAGRISNLEASLALEQQRLEQQEQEAAQRERTGRAVTPDLQTDIERSRSQIGFIETEIAQRRQQQEASSKAFAADRSLFEGGECAVTPEGV